MVWGGLKYGKADALLQGGPSRGLRVGVAVHGAPCLPPVLPVGGFSQDVTPVPLSPPPGIVSGGLEVLCAEASLAWPGTMVSWTLMNKRHLKAHGPRQGTVFQDE